MALTPQMRALGERLHPDFFNDVNDEGMWRGSYPVSLVHSSDLMRFRHSDRRGSDDRGDSQQVIDDFAQHFSNGGGLRHPIVLEHGLRRPSHTYINEGHHRVEGAQSAGGILLPTVAQVSKYGHSRPGYVHKNPPKELQPDRYGWHPKIADPDILIGAR